MAGRQRVLNTPQKNVAETSDYKQENMGLSHDTPTENLL